MLPSVGFAEMVVLMLLAIIVVDPKDLPKLMRTLGQWMGKIRAMGQEFKDAFNDMDAEGEIAEMRREIQELKKLSPLSEDFDEDLANEMRGLDSDIREATDMSSPRKPDTSS
ncbi:Sec-independent protein translocase protein TatB [Litorimonas sp. RW-G-Af-16]|uniref:Sec-independent protein translocase protein TatB n=1 Tax=Litorimonas sp. RW-G-Af-16 TaxID=3241168 RepID=UPI003AAB4629